MLMVIRQHYQLCRSSQHLDIRLIILLKTLRKLIVKKFMSLVVLLRQVMP